ncbi:hypothetical protein [Tautonia plasticadhaerens]|uniref:Uncharacterized protein n=1 Tax=Tautonia plasticadhaerens TaxID=2527974 RepID=A0A518H1Y4_9BACT|nr:hypothetical protein [Tautonia plasticadhaerens]QDV34830.1 hypothetical protein ElP_27270 [Tautonia plasticadhaerens]
MNSFLLPEFLALYRPLPGKVRRRPVTPMPSSGKIRITRAFVFAEFIPSARVFSARVGCILGRWACEKAMTSPGSGSARTPSLIVP